MHAVRSNPSWRDWPSLGPAVFVATGGWVGFFPFAPGTVGTLWGLPLSWGLMYAPPWTAGLILAVLFAVGVPMCSAAARRLGRKDPGAVVWDEIVTLPLVFLTVPPTSVAVCVAGFLLHRFFDVSKIPPARQLESLPDGLGIMSDDVIAAAYAGAALHTLRVLEWV